jgi:hypothetical protein
MWDGESQMHDPFGFGQLALENMEYSSIFVGHKDNKASFHEKKFSL